MTTAVGQVPQLLRAGPGIPVAALPRRRWGHLLALLAVTVAGGVLRFTRLDQPALWGDEAATFSRVCGTFQQLLDILQTDGFAPLHYELYWVIGRFVTLTPHAMRFVPALAGTLMIPAMYLLARQMAGRNTALLTAMLTACSAYLLVYSRDAKMYMHSWLFSALAAGCLLWWLRTNLRIAWLAWVASGLAALGLHSTGGLVLSLYPIFLFTQRRLHWRTAVLFVVGLTIIGAGSAGYYLGFNRWTEVSGGLTPGVQQAGPDARMRNWAAGGLSWIDPLTRGKPAMELVRHSATAYLFAYSRAEEFPGPTGRIEIPRRITRLVNIALWTILGICAVGLLPWPMRWTGVGEEGDQSWWRGALWMSAWLLLPTYGFFYCRSVDGFASPQAWIDMAAEWLGHGWGWWALLSIAVMLAASLWRPLGMGVLLMLTGGLVGSLTFAVIRARWQWLDAWLAIVCRPVAARVWLAVALGLIWYFCCPTFTGRLARPLQLALIAALLIGACWAAYAFWHHLYERAMKLNGYVDWQSMWMPRYLAIIWPAVAIALAALLIRLPTRPLRWAAIALVLGVNLAQGTARAWVASEQPIDRVAADVIASQPAQATTRAYVQTIGGMGGPSTGSLHNHVGRYYMTILSGKKISPPEFRMMPVQFQHRIWDYAYPPRIAADMKRDTQIQTLIVWDTIVPPRVTETTQAPTQDPIAAALGTEWTKQSEEIRPVRVFWNWQTVASYRRRVYARQPPTPADVAAVSQPPGASAVH